MKVKNLVEGKCSKWRNMAFMGFMGSELWLVRANAYIVRSPENFQMFDQFNSTFQPAVLTSANIRGNLKHSAFAEQAFSN